ncbi:putative transposase domain-containing protein [Phytophthora infestans]|uniref:Putative transposase domain-containing protein n=1 Tax=Phytophthora infestans TaxID=4787 RepID=A0A8S9UB35_PHYIN|nr:putative transposase domain-containing protein [Phytophthora infestans]
MWKIRCWYSYPKQLIFVNETSKSELDNARRYAWAKRGERAIVRAPFARGERVSILVACDVSGFVG